MLQRETYGELVQQIPFGKQLPDALYVHRELLGELTSEVADIVVGAQKIAGISDDEYDVLKFATSVPRLSFLSYPGFFEEAFPVLRYAWAVDLQDQTVRRRCFEQDGNPPILHRKETLLPPGHPKRPQFERLTREAERMGLFEDAVAIGHLRGWEVRMRRLGLATRGHDLVEDPNTRSIIDEPDVKRHKTALHRYSLSSPMQALWQHGYLDGTRTVFDYGCGHGDDVATLRQHGIGADGWDPNFAPEEPVHDADVVNLGFVLNVIEDVRERREALTRAFQLARCVLAVAVLIGGRSAYEQNRLYRDGVLTQRGTFQKYFSQAELKDYLEETLNREPVAVAPGLFFVFRSDGDEQAFLANRQSLRRTTGTLLPTTKRARLYAARPTAKPRVREPKLSKWDRHVELVDALWVRMLDLGRMPEGSEFDRQADLRALGTTKAIVKHLVETKGTEQLDEARSSRRADLLVYLCLNMFERRRSFSSLPERSQLDIKAFLPSYRAAQQTAQELLFSVGQPSTIRQACLDAAEQGLGWLDHEHSLQLHTSMVNQLPAVLRVYLGCAARLYGDVQSADLVKLHITSGKVSVMLYDDFEGKAVPDLVERVKINLRSQQIDFFEYGTDYPPQPLYMKSRYIPSDFPHYEEQLAFDTALDALGAFDFSRFGPDRDSFASGMKSLGLRIDGFTLTKERRKRTTRSR